MNWIDILLLAACVGSGMMAGLFGAFSSFVMRALASIPAPEGARAMQAINRVIIRPSFLGIFLGTPVAGLGAWWLVRQEPGAAAAFTLAGSLCYLLACLVSTVAFNVPLNNQLAETDPETAEGQAVWDNYVHRWTRWNHVRAGATLISTVLLAWALYLR